MSKKFIESDGKYEVYENPTGGDRLVPIDRLTDRNNEAIAR
jgi:hypothetical protein